MKTKIAVLVCLALLAGCSDRKQAEQVKKLEAKVVVLEDRIEKMRRVFLEGNENSIQANEHLKTALVTLSNVISSEVRIAAREIEASQQELIEREVLAEVRRMKEELRALPAPRAAAATAPSPRAPEALKNGVPASVYNKIAADAAREWPGDFKMQSWLIQGQIEAYRKLHP